MEFTNKHALTYNENYYFALFFETEIKTAIQVLLFLSPSVYFVTQTI